MIFHFTLLLLIDACIMNKQTCIHFIQLSSRQVSPSSGIAGMVMSIILPLISVQYVISLTPNFPYLFYKCVRMNARTHARAHARTHASTHARTHARTYARTLARMHACTHVLTYLRKHVRTVCTHTHMHARTHVRMYAHTSLYASYFVSGIVLCMCVRYLIAIWRFVYALFIHTNMCNNFELCRY